MAVHGNWISGNNYLSINCITSDGDSHRDTFVFSTFGSMASRHIYGKNLDRILPRRKYHFEERIVRIQKLVFMLVICDVNMQMLVCLLLMFVSVIVYQIMLRQKGYIF